MDSSSNIPVTVELPPLNIPDGVSPEELSKLTMNILLRKALTVNDPLSKWILLGATEVLQDRVPRLTPTMLSNLHTAQQSQVSVEDKGIQCEKVEKINKQ